jgi:hypothetical protein
MTVSVVGGAVRVFCICIVGISAMDGDNSQLVNDG